MWKWGLLGCGKANSQSHSGEIMNQIVFDTTTRIWARRETYSERVERARGAWKESQRIYDVWALLWEDLFLWQARKYFSNLSPCWHQCVTDTNMPPLTHPCPLTLPAFALRLLVFKSAGNDAAHWKWWEQGERETGRGETNEEKKRDTSSPESPRDSRAVENVCSSSLHPPPESAVFQEAQGLSTHSLALTSHLWLA